MDPQTGTPYTVTISQEGISKRLSEAPEEESYDRTYRVRTDENLKSELVVEPKAAAAPRQTMAVGQPAGADNHDLRQMLLP